MCWLSVFFLEPMVACFSEVGAGIWWLLRVASVRFRGRGRQRRTRSVWGGGGRVFDVVGVVSPVLSLGRCGRRRGACVEELVPVRGGRRGWAV